jgi:uncharacterized protein
MAHANEDLLRRGYEAFATGDIDTVLSLFAPDITWYVSGDSQVSGEYHGHQEVMAFLGKTMEMTGGTFRVEVHDIVANDTRGAVMVTAYGQRDGKSLEMPEVHAWRLADGKATEFRTFVEDSAETDRFFS